MFDLIYIIIRWSLSILGIYLSLISIAGGCSNICHQDWLHFCKLERCMWLIGLTVHSFDINYPNLIKYLQLIVLASQLMHFILTSHYGSSCVWMFFLSCFLWKFGRMGLSGQKKRQLVLQKGYLPYPRSYVSLILYAWVGSYMNSSVSSPYVEVLSYRSTLLLHFSHRSYPFSCLGGRGSGFLSFISSFSNNYNIYLPISTFQNLTDCWHYTFIECPIFRE